LGNHAWGMKWNYDGSRLAVITKNKQMHVFDPRQQDAVQVTQSHESSKAQRLVWLGESNNILSTGFSNYGERQYAIWDSRNMETPLTLRKLDNSMNVPFIHYDESSKVVYIVNKGVGII
jgi:WD40 repeat protein